MGGQLTSNGALLSDLSRGLHVKQYENWSQNLANSENEDKFIMIEIRGIFTANLK